MERLRKYVEKLGIGRKIDEFAKKLRTWPHIKKFSISLVLLGMILWTLIIPVSLNMEKKVDDYYKSLGVEYEFFSVSVPSHLPNDIPEEIKLEGIALYPKGSKSLQNGSIPAILQINGANNRKERNHDMSIQLVKRGMAVFIIEQRGHGESEGRATFYGEEPGDVSHVLDYLTESYKWINSTHFGALGFSLGAGCLLIAQALDSRLYACSLFHPPTDITSIFQQVDVVGITGSILFERPSYAPEDVEPLVARTAFYWCNSSNTENTIMIQGDNDTLVPAPGTIKFYNELNTGNRTDIQLHIRPGLNHEPNEADSTSRKLSIAWLLSYFGNDTEKITHNRQNITANLNSIELYEFNPPQSMAIRELTWIGLFFIELGILFYGILIGDSIIPKLVDRFKKRAGEILRNLGGRIRKKIKSKQPIPPENTDHPQDEVNHSSDIETIDSDSEMVLKEEFDTRNLPPLDAKDPQVLFLQQMVVHALIILPTAIILGIINGFSMPNLLYGLFIEFPLIVGLLFHISRTYYSNPEHKPALRVIDPFPFPAPERIKDEFSITAVMTILLLIPPFIAIALYDWGAHLTLLWPVHPWKIGLLVYILALGSLFYISHTLVESYMKEQSYAGVVGLTFLWFLGASQYLLFNPVEANFGNITFALIIVIGFGLFMTFMGLFHRTLKNIFGKVIVVELLTATIIAFWILENFMNII
jgi:alpha/beta superfamily hydrolase